MGHSFMRETGVAERSFHHDPCNKQHCRSRKEDGCPVISPDLRVLQNAQHSDDRPNPDVVTTCADHLQILIAEEPQITVFQSVNDGLIDCRSPAELISNVAEKHLVQQVGRVKQRRKGVDTDNVSEYARKPAAGSDRMRDA